MKLRNVELRKYKIPLIAKMTEFEEKKKYEGFVHKKKKNAFRKSKLLSQNGVL